MPAKSVAGELLRSIAADAVKRLAPALAAAVLPPAIVVLAWGKEYASRSHAVPGWAILTAAGLFGVLALIGGAQVVQYVSERRRTLVIVPKGDTYALHWCRISGETGEAPTMTVCADLQVTNVTDGSLSVPNIVFIAWGRVWILPVLFQAVGPGLRKAVPASTSGRQRLGWHLDRAIARPGRTLTAKIGLVDQFGRVNWSPWLRWRFVEPA